MKKTVFVDGQYGTTGLKIHSRLGNRDDIELIESILIVSRFDNLEKGASGAAVQNMNITIGVPENKGL